MQSFHLAVDQWPVVGVGWPPVVQTYAVSKPVCQPMCNRKTPAPLQLRQHNYHLPETPQKFIFCRLEGKIVFTCEEEAPNQQYATGPVWKQHCSSPDSRI